MVMFFISFAQLQELITCKFCIFIITVLNEVVEDYVFTPVMSFCPQGGVSASVHAGNTTPPEHEPPREQTPPEADTHPKADTPGEQTPPQSRLPPMVRQTPPPKA